MAAGTAIHLLDVGQLPYGDAVLCEFGERKVLIDGGHPGDEDAKGPFIGIAAQLEAIFGHPAPFHLDLLVVSHAHLDHIGCLPALVRDGALRADFALVSDPDLGWGRSPTEPPPDAPRTREAVLLAALREEALPSRVSDDVAADWLADAADLETTYRAMLASLTANGTTVVRLGQDDLDPLQDGLAAIGLQVLGPSQAQLVACADAIRTSTDALADRLGGALAPDAAGSIVDAYRRVLSAVGQSDAQDAVSRLGAAVNLQSSVLTFEVDGARYLFAGDMQFVHPGVASGGIPVEVDKLRSLVGTAAPFAFAKLSHHGSDNAVDRAWLASLGATPIVGICAGSGSTKHPNPSVLQLLDQRRQQLQWGRTDRNGEVVVRVEHGQPPQLTVSRGQPDDARPNVADVEPTPMPPLRPAVGPAVSVVSEAARGRSSGAVELTASIPATLRRVQITVDIDGGRKPDDVEPATPSGPERAPTSARPAPSLLYATSPDALIANIGRDEASGVLDDLHDRPGRVVEIPAGLPIAEAASRVTGALTRDLVGVVLVGGYDVLASQRVDALPADVRARVQDGEDADNFIIWSDDVYGDLDGDGLPELPVSRVPDGHTSELVRAALRAPAPARQARSRGLRNVERPFADQVYAALPAAAPMLVSAEVTFLSPELDMTGRNVYVMLHGDYVDGSRFWGEHTAGDAEAMNVQSVPASPDAVILAGACWGALIVDTPAARVATSRPFGHRTPSGSIALSFVLQGARGFVGCTGSHYSPLDPPFNFYGGPLHALFWQAIQGGMGPAAALLAAKQAYVPGIPHGPRRPGSVAIELKIWRQFTCLGLGW
jgi:beta-lactamase superfamily II metal-dependent hydrolase